MLIDCLRHGLEHHYDHARIPARSWRQNDSLKSPPDFEGKKSFKKLPAIFDIIGRMTWEDVGEDGEEQLITVLTVKSASSILTKTRFDNMPALIGNPSFDKIMGWVHEHYDIKEKEDE